MVGKRRALFSELANESFLASGVGLRTFKSSFTREQTDANAFWNGVAVIFDSNFLKWPLYF